jgi:hypothetical protein
MPPNRGSREVTAGVVGLVGAADAVTPMGFATLIREIQAGLKAMGSNAVAAAPTVVLDLPGAADALAVRNRTDTINMPPRRALLWSKSPLVISRDVFMISPCSPAPCMLAATIVCRRILTALAQPLHHLG